MPRIPPIGPDLDRQPRPGEVEAGNRRPPPARVPETRPTPLQDWFIYLSLVVLVCGVVVITGLELGVSLTDPLIRLPLLLGGVVLLAVTADALVRVWRSAWAWLPVDRGRAVFRLVWSAVLAAILVGTGALLMLALTL
ncbi:MAG: hypothetical protein M3N29_04960 [Chloroflexota bacterium]|nr:hypothetical protein [Chloroflexota bacterium]